MYKLCNNLKRIFDEGDIFLRGFLDGYKMEKGRREKRKMENKEKREIAKLVKMEVDQRWK